MNKVILALGSNIGDRQNNINQALLELKNKIIITKFAKTIETSALLCNKYTNTTEDKNKYLNTVIIGYTNYHHLPFLNYIKKIEKKLGRIQNKQKWKARIIDIDIIYWNKDIIKHKNLNIPHEEMQNRYFVLYPLSMILPNFLHPILKKNTKQLLDNLL
ncbi:MAG: 2-amino-4-hydroxy-6-hydroxymethyldihydropteridine diphosphokinase [Anaplasmataceae bacterium]|nr:2-amino-4-hydroxy-6-hydroxymethyldihydropteridine diphosphokinase [Anaplasmataceae bacterium]